MSATHNQLKLTAMLLSTSKATAGTNHRGDGLVAALPILTKYAKIQPAVAIKPKPSGVTTIHKSSFNPQYDPQASASAFFSDDPGSNINVLRKWVLPARPRPGRKPVSSTPPAAASAAALAVEDHCGLAKKRFKGPKNGQVPDIISLPSSTGAGSPGSVAMSPSYSNTSVNTSRATISSYNGTNTPGVDELLAKSTSMDTTIKPASKQVTALQEAYLAKLKEQELIQNYIETLLNQIKEFRFVQSGMITADALNSINNSDEKKTSSLRSPDQLDHISNVRDLDKFLAHLTTQSNIIHSVTKKYIDEGTGSRNPVRLQIEHYLQLRKLHQDKSCARAPSKHSASSRSIPHPSSDITTLGAEPLISDLDINSDANLLAAVSKPATFTPSLLRPLDIDLFEEHDVIGVETVENDIFDKLKSIDDSELEFAPILKQATAQGRKKMGCGFCSGDTPCLCFDADNIFGEK